MKFIDEHVHTSYEDYTGIMKLDARESGLFRLCEDNKIDTDKHFPIGFRFYDESINGVDTDQIHLVIYTLERPTPNTTYDDLVATIRQNDGKAKVESHSLHISPSELSGYIKRFDMLAISTEMHNSIKHLEIDE